MIVERCVIGIVVVWVVVRVDSRPRPDPNSSPCPSTRGRETSPRPALAPALEAAQPPPHARHLRVTARLSQTHQRI